MKLGLQTLGTVALVGLITACPGRSSEDDASGTTDTSTSDATSTSSADTTSADTTSADTTATTDATSTTDATTTDTGSAMTETTSATTDSTGTGGGMLVGYAECPSGRAAECPETDPLCVHSFGGGSTGPGGSFSEFYSFCTRECETDADCATAVSGGMAESKCVVYDDTNVCAFDCAFGQSCPEGMGCHAQDVCMWEHCDCSGEGCDLCS